MTDSSSPPTYGNHRRWIFRAALLVTTACGGGGDKPPTTPVDVASVTVTPDRPALLQNATTQLGAEVKGTDGSTLTRSLTWTSSAPNVATVSATGLVTAVGQGTATITAAAEGKSGSTVVSTHVIRSADEYREWYPRIVDIAKPADVALTVIADPFTDRVQLTLNDGPAIVLAKLASPNAFGTAIPSDRLVANYRTGDLHHVVGFLDFYTGSQRTVRINASVNVLDATVPAAAVTTLAADAQATQHVANLRYDTPYFGAAAPSEVTRRFYALFPDAFDFLAVVEPVQSTANRNFVRVRNRVNGIGVPLVDDAQNRGSASRLLGTIQFPIDGFFDLGETAALHEMGHAFINFLSGTAMAAGIPHWPMSTVAYGVMGGSQGPNRQGVTFPYRLTPMGNGDYRTDAIEPPTEFNDLELYMLGLAAPSEVGVHTVFTNQDQNPATGVLRGPTELFTIDDLIARVGARNPAYPSAPTTFRIGTIVLSAGRLLTADEMAYFDHLAARGEATTPLQYSSGLARGTTKPFYLATKQRGRLETSVR